MSREETRKSSMKKRPNIILTGFMATGKTTVGKLLAGEFGYEFVDTDKLIEKRTGLSVAQIFRQQGEAAFRELETDLAGKLAQRQGQVIATGGRFMLDPRNAAALSAEGRVFCLVATPEEILGRVEQDAHVRRPLLEVPNPIERIVELLQERQVGYSRFPQMVTSGKSPKEVADILAALYRESLDDLDD